MPYAKDFETKNDNHVYERLEDSRYQCKVCGHTVVLNRMFAGAVKFKEVNVAIYAKRMVIYQEHP